MGLGRVTCTYEWLGAIVAAAFRGELREHLSGWPEDAALKTITLDPSSAMFHFFFESVEWPDDEQPTDIEIDGRPFYPLPEDVSVAVRPSPPADLKAARRAMAELNAEFPPPGGATDQRLVDGALHTGARK